MIDYPTAFSEGDIGDDKTIRVFPVDKLPRDDYEAEKLIHPITCYLESAPDNWVPVTEFNLIIIECWQQMTEIFVEKTGTADIVLAKFCEARRIEPLEFEALLNGCCIIESLYESARQKKIEDESRHGKNQYNRAINNIKSMS